MSGVDGISPGGAVAPDPAPSYRGYGAGVRLLSIGIASTGVVTFAYFSLASYALGDVEYKRISLLWSVLFITVSVLYRPIEQLLSRTIAARRAQGLHAGHPLRTPLLIQTTFAGSFLLVALALRPWITDELFDGSATLYWVLVAGVLAYAASYFARGWLAGHTRFGLYGGLVFMEAVSRCCFAAAVAVGIASGQEAVALGMAAAPLVSLVVVPWAFRRRPRREPERERAQNAQLGMARGGRFALAVFGIILAEQTLLNAAVITADATARDSAVAGYVFNALLIARAPLQLFQAIQGSLLPHLAGAHAADDVPTFRRAVRITVLGIAGFAGSVALGLLVLGPWVMDLLFDDTIEYGRWGLALVGLGMGLHLAAGTFNQAALARDRASAAAAAWIVGAVAFVVFMAVPLVGDPLLRAEVGYAGASGLLCLLLYGVYRRYS